MSDKITNIGILRTGLSNELNVINVLKYFKANVVIIKRAEDFGKIDGLVIPGVGNFNKVMYFLKKKKLASNIKDFVKKKPILGICIGLQIFFQKSEEGLNSKGLSLIKHDIKKLNFKNTKRKTIIGWNKVVFNKNPLIKLKSGTYYFCHSFYPDMKNSRIIKGYSRINNFSYPVFVNLNNFFGVQFHPEKSGLKGIQLYKSFINFCKKNSIKLKAKKIIK